jgi:hypothetical protein
MNDITVQIMDMLTYILPLILNLFIIFVVLLVSLAVARLLQRIVTSIAKLIKIDYLLKSVKVNEVLKTAEIKKNPSELLGDFFYWITIFIVIISVVSLSGLNIQPILEQLIEYGGIVFTAALALSLGIVLAYIISAFIFIIASNFGLSGAKFISRTMQYVIVIFSFLIALEKLGIGSELIVPSMGVIIGSVGLALAIAFGLGCKDIIADIFSNLVKGK